MKSLMKCIGLCLFTMFLFGCENDVPELKFLEYINDVEKKYDQLADLQISLENAEKLESEMYAQIIQQTPDPNGGEEYKKLLENRLKRENLINREKQILIELGQQTTHYEKVAARIIERKVKEEASVCLEFIKGRNELNKEVVKRYETGLSKDLELYKQLNKAEGSIASLDKIIKEANRNYRLIIKAQGRFNKKAFGWNKVASDYRRSIKST